MKAAAAVVALAVSWAGQRAPARQQSQPQQSHPGWPCIGRPDPAYFKIAEASGGQVFLFDPSELGASAVLMSEGMRHPATVLRVAGSLVEGVHSFDVPIDSTIESVLFSISLQCLQVVEIATPTGALLEDGGEGVDAHRFEAGRVIVVAHPPAGAWRVTVSGRGLFFLVVQARTPLALDGVRFVAPSGRPGHGGLFPVHGPPAYGVPQWLEVTVGGDVRAPRFQLVSSANELLQPIELRPVTEESSGETRTFLGQVTPRSRQFRVAVSGVDATGAPFQRVHAPLYSTAGSE